ncbi:MAG TPA: response regulator [Actinomycetota bacterium]
MSSRSERPRVLIAEDDAIIRLDLKEMLEEESYEVLEAADGEKAVDLARAGRPEVVIVDIKMPVMDGLSAAKRITEERIAPVVVLTAFPQRELVQRATEVGAMAYLVKPFQKKDLLPAIEIAKGRYQQLETLTSEVGDLAERLEVRTLVERAKGELMDKAGMSEADAFRFIQRGAMERRLTLKAMAEAVLAGDLQG